MVESSTWGWGVGGSRSTRGVGRVGNDCFGQMVLTTESSSVIGDYWAPGKAPGKQEW